MRDHLFRDLAHVARWAICVERQACGIAARDLWQLRRRLLRRRAIATLFRYLLLLPLFGCRIRRDLSQGDIRPHDHALAVDDDRATTRHLEADIAAALFVVAFRVGEGVI